MTVADEVREQVPAEFQWRDLMFYYYGFELETPVPTLELAGKRFGAITRQRVQQIKDDFIGYIERPKIRSMMELSNLLSTNPIWSAQRLDEAQARAGLDLGNLEIRSLLRLLEDGKYPCNFDLFESNMEKITNREETLPEDWILVRNDIADAVRTRLSHSKKLPAKNGMAPVTDVLREVDNHEIQASLRFIWSMDEDFVSFGQGNNEYFVFEDHRNALVGQLRKVASVIRTADLHELRQSLQRSLRNGNFTPTTAQIGDYLNRTKNVRIDGNQVRFEIVGQPHQRM